MNTGATALPITFTMLGRNLQNDDEDGDGLPDAWEMQYFGTTGYGPGQDNDGDGVNNLLECAFNLNPARPDVALLTPGTGTAGLPSVRLIGVGNDAHLAVEFVRRRGGLITYAVQFWNLLDTAGWEPAVNAPTVTVIDANWERVVVEDNVTMADASQRFGRVVVSKP